MEERTLTEAEIPRINDAGADAQEQHALLAVLGAVLGHDDVRGGFADGVRAAYGDVVVADKFDVGVAAGDEGDFLGFAFQDERHEVVEEVDGADDVGFGALDQLLF